MLHENGIKVLYCTDTLMAGGAERQLVELLVHLDRTRFRPRVLCLHSIRANCSLHFAPALDAAQIPLQVFDIRWKPAEILQSMIRLTATTWKVRPKILHTINHHSNHIARLSRLVLPPSMKLITGIRTDYNARQLLYERLEGWAAEVVVCNSPAMERKLIEQSHLSKNKVLYIPNGIDVRRFERKPEENVREQLAPTAKYVITMVGRISKQKSPDLLAESIGILKRRGQLPVDTSLLLVGEREDETVQAHLDQIIRQYELSKVVIQFPQTDYPERFYHAADFTVLATLWEGMPNAAIESLAAGRPVVISEAANAAGLIDPDITGWVVRTGDVKHLAETLNHVLGLTHEHLEGMRQACQQRAGEFGLGQMVERYQELYDRLRATPKPKI